MMKFKLILVAIIHICGFAHGQDNIKATYGQVAKYVKNKPISYPNFKLTFKDKRKEKRTTGDYNYKVTIFDFEIETPNEKKVINWMPKSITDPMYFEVTGKRYFIELEMSIKVAESEKVKYSSRISYAIDAIGRNTENQETYEEEIYYALHLKKDEIVIAKNNIELLSQKDTTPKIKYGEVIKYKKDQPLIYSDFKIIFKGKEEDRLGSKYNIFLLETSTENLYLRPSFYERTSTFTIGNHLYIIESYQSYRFRDTEKTKYSDRLKDIWIHYPEKRGVGLMLEVDEMVISKIAMPSTFDFSFRYSKDESKVNYGEVVTYNKYKTFIYPDFKLIFMGKRQEKNKRKIFTYYDFAMATLQERRILSWTIDDEEIAPIKFEINNEKAKYPNRLKYEGKILKLESKELMISEDKSNSENDSTVKNTYGEIVKYEKNKPLIYSDLKVTYKGEETDTLGYKYHIFLVETPTETKIIKEQSCSLFFHGLNYSYFIEINESTHFNESEKLKYPQKIKKHVMRVVTDMGCEEKIFYSLTLAPDEIVINRTGIKISDK